MSEDSLVGKLIVNNGIIIFKESVQKVVAMASLAARCFEVAQKGKSRPFEQPLK